MMNEIALLDELAANAVPPVVRQDLDGWHLRAAFGVTRRANSVLLVRHSTRLSLAEKITLAEAFYCRQGLPCRFQLSPVSQPEGLEAELAARGFKLSPPTLVQTGLLEPLLSYATGRTAVRDSVDEGWLAAYALAEGEANPSKLAARHEMLRRIGPPAGFALLIEDGQPSAVALGVVERGWLGMFSVVTVPYRRRRGLATAVLGDLAVWAREHGAEQAYLQVFSANTIAQRLYQRLGFHTRYQYWYRERL